MKDNKQDAKKAELDIIEQILDGTADVVTLVDESDNEVEFEWIATIPYKTVEQTRIYCIMQPIGKVDGVEENEAIVFKIYEEEIDGYDDIEVEQDFEIAEAVFAEYEKLCESDD